MIFFSMGDCCMIDQGLFLTKNEMSPSEDIIIPCFKVLSFMLLPYLPLDWLTFILIGKVGLTLSLFVVLSTKVMM